MKLLNDIIKRIKSIKHPQKRYLYAVLGGVYLGEMFVLMDNQKKQKQYCFLSLPDLHIRTVTYEKFEFGLNNKIVDVVEKLPKNVYLTCVAQYNQIVSKDYMLNKAVTCKRMSANK